MRGEMVQLEPARTIQTNMGQFVFEDKKTDEFQAGK
jgi:hypothetical protein